MNSLIQFQIVKKRRYFKIIGTQIVLYFGSMLFLDILGVYPSGGERFIIALLIFMLIIQYLHFTDSNRYK